MPQLTSENREKMLVSYPRKAWVSLGEAQAAIAQATNDPTKVLVASNRAYYAVYLAANAWMAYKGGYPNLAERRNNWSHETVNEHWVTILDQIDKDAGVQADYDGDTIYTKLKALRVRVDYSISSDPTIKDVTDAVDASQRATGWLLKALKTVQKGNKR